MLNLIPEPRRLRMGEGAFVLTPETCIVTDRGGAEMLVMAGQLREEIGRTCGIRPAIICGQAQPGDICLQHAAEQPPEGYVLRITPEQVTIAADTAGLRYGVQTLRQIVRSSGWRLPAMEAEDAPRFAARGFYHDVTRGRVPTLEWLKQLADECCFYKLNQLQLYVEHTYLFRDLTELHSVAVTPLTAEEILELDEYCAVRGIELVPSLSTFGHMLELLRTKRFSHLCELEDAAAMPSTMPNRMAHHTIDPTNPESFRLVTAMIDEYLPLFRSRRFNICADETFDLGRGRNQGREERGLYMGFVKALCDHVASKGRIPMFWGDIVLKFPVALGELPAGTICLNWGYSADVREDSVRVLAQTGATQYVCPGVRGWNRWLPLIRSSYENIRRMAEYGVKYGAAGLLNTDWGDYGHINDPRLSLPGLIFGACAAWNGGLPEFDALCGTISRLTYGDRSGAMLASLERLSDVPVYSWWHIVRYKDQAQGVLTDPWEEPGMQPVPDARLQGAQRKHAVWADALKDCCLHMDAEGRTAAARWLDAAEASRLWDAAYHAVLQGRKDAEIARALERWLQRYERQWREVSKESELWRIRDVTVWYAQQLRSVACG